MAGISDFWGLLLTSPEELSKRLSKITTADLGGLHQHKLKETEWSDELFNEKYYVPAVKMIRKEISKETSLNLAKLFLCIYLGCDELPEGITLRDLYFSLLPAVKIGGIHVVDSNRTMADQVVAVPKKTIVSSYTFLKCQRNSKMYDAPNGRQTFSATSINEWLQRMLALAEEPDTRQLFINMVCFIMLVVLRLMKRENESVDCVMPMGAYQAFLRLEPSFTKTGNNPFPPPHTKFYSLFDTMHPSCMPSKYLWALLIHSYISHGRNTKVVEFIKAGCLENLHGLGIGAIQWSSKLHEKLKVDLKDVLPYLATNKMNETISKITKFYENTQPKSWPWSRLFEDGAYYSLSTSNNSTFCLVCAYMTNENPKVVEKMPQFKKCLKWEFEDAHKYAIAALLAMEEDGLLTPKNYD